MYGQWLDLAVAAQGKNPFPVFFRIRRIAGVNNTCKAAVSVYEQVFSFIVTPRFSAGRALRGYFSTAVANFFEFGDVKAHAFKLTPKKPRTDRLSRFTECDFAT
jgi:hypothetical protein